MDLGDQAQRVKFMIRDRGSNFTAAFDAVLADAGIRTVLCNVATPRMNAIAERWIGGCRRELLDRTLVWNQAHLRRILREYETHHNQHRPHRSRHGAAPLKPLPEPFDLDQYRVRRQARVGGLINEYRLVALLGRGFGHPQPPAERHRPRTRDGKPAPDIPQGARPSTATPASIRAIGRPGESHGTAQHAAHRTGFEGETPSVPTRQTLSSHPRDADREHQQHHLVAGPCVTSQESPGRVPHGRTSAQLPARDAFRAEDPDIGSRQDQGRERAGSPGEAARYHNRGSTRRIIRVAAARGIWWPRGAV